MNIQSVMIRLIICTAGLISLVTAAYGQPTRPQFEIDLQTLLGQSLEGRRVTDPVWQVTPREGFTAIEIPIIIKQPASDISFDANTLKMRGGKFVAWRFDLSPQSQRPRHTRSVTKTVTRTETARSGRGDDIVVTRGLAEADRLGTGLLPSTLQGEVQRVEPQVVETVEVTVEETLTEEQIAAAMNRDPDKGVTVILEGTPMMATRLIYHPDGTFRWNLDRRIANATVRQAPENPYVLLLDRQLLMSLNPAMQNRAQRNQSGQPTRMTTEQRQQQKQAQAAYNKLKKELTQLPTTFRRYYPEKVQGIYMIRDQAKQLTLSGMQSGNWNLDIAEFKQAASLAKSSSRNADDLDLTLLQTLIKRKPVYDLRLAATVIAMSNLCELVEESEAVNRLIEDILVIDDAESKLLVTRALIAVSQPSGVTAKLLGIAAVDGDKQVQLTALGGLLAIDLRDDLEAKAVVDAINTLLADPQGLPVEQILATTIDAAVAGGSRKAHQLAQYLDLASSLNDAAVWSRTKQAIDFIAKVAHLQPLAADWLDRKLLGSGNDQIILATLESLASVIPPDQTIYITRSDHYLFSALENPNQAIRRLAWQASKRFSFDSRLIVNNARSDDDDTPRQGVYQRIVAAALLDHPTPGEAAILLGKDNTDPATQALIEIAVKGKGAGSLDAAQALVGAKREPTMIFEDFTPEQRQIFASKLYQRVYQVDTAVVGLLRIDDRRVNVIKWFTDAFDQGPVPEPYRWARQLDNNTALVSLTADADSEIALAAITALILSEGGTEADGLRWHEQFNLATNRTQTGLESLWLRAQTETRFKSLEKAQGEYEMVIQVMAEAKRSRGGRDNAVDQMPVQGFTVARGGSKGKVRLPYDDEFADATTIEPGKVYLKCDPQQQRVWFENLDLRITLATGVDTPIALQLASPGELVKLPSTRIASYSFEKVTQPVDLMLYPDASWRGTFMFDGGKAVRVSLLPQ